MRYRSWNFVRGLKRRLAGFGPVHLLLLLSVAELVIYRLAVPSLQQKVAAGETPEPTPLWHTAIDYVGVFTFYFTGTLAIVLLVARVTRSARTITQPRPLFHKITEVTELVFVIGVALVAANTLLAVEPSKDASFALTTVFALATVAIVARTIRRGVDIGAVIGLVLVGAPLIVFYVAVVAARINDAADPDLIEYGVSAVCLAAIASPYCFGPRPFTYAVTRIAPVVVAMLVAGACALIARQYYDDAVVLARRGLGIQLDVDRPDPQLALYILALATLSWTIASCAIAETAGRRRVGVGLALVALGGYGFAQPVYLLVMIVGLVTIADAIPELRTSERAGHRVVVTPPIEDRIWQSYVTSLVGTLRDGGHSVNALTTRGEDDSSTTIVTGRVAERAFRLRIDRIASRVHVVDARFGREPAVDRPPVFAIHARRRGHELPPDCGPAFKLDDEAFDGRLRARGDRGALEQAIDPSTLTRLSATLDGWLAAWKGETVRQRIYPGQGAPMDQPIPISDLSDRRAGPDAVNRLAAAIELLGEIARRAVPPEVEPPADVEAAAPPPADDAETDGGAA
jgi:hypothetical protein